MGGVIGWMIDLARDATLSPAWLRGAAEAGYDAVGLYLEHRFAYRSAPWAAGPGALTPETVRSLDRRGLRLIPFLNTLGHMEGFIRAEEGRWLAEGPAVGSLQMCPSREPCVRFAEALIEDALDAFDDEWVHIGGDETKQLGQCPACAGKTDLYARHFSRLCRFVLDRGRRPCLWGDMLLQHPDALDAIPRQTVIFDWQYFGSPRATTRIFRDRGFDVVGCPSIQTYNSGWCFLDATRDNIDAHAAVSKDVFVTTWELTYFTQYETILPVVWAAARRLRDGAWPALPPEIETLGVRIPSASTFLAAGGWRTLRDRLVMRRNPFALWRDWRDEACGPVGDEILRLCDEVGELAELHRVAVEWVRLVERARAAYDDPRRSADILAGGEALLERLRPPLHPPDGARLDALIACVRLVVERLRALGPFRPSFETLVDDGYIPGDQAAWGCGA